MWCRIAWTVLPGTLEHTGEATTSDVMSAFTKVLNPSLVLASVRQSRHTKPNHNMPRFLTAAEIGVPLQQPLACLLALPVQGRAAGCSASAEGCCSRWHRPGGVDGQVAGSTGGPYRPPVGVYVPCMSLIQRKDRTQHVGDMAGRRGGWRAAGATCDIGRRQQRLRYGA